MTSSTDPSILTFLNKKQEEVDASREIGSKVFEKIDKKTDDILSINHEKKSKQEKTQSGKNKILIPTACLVVFDQISGVNLMGLGFDVMGDLLNYNIDQVATYADTLFEKNRLISSVNGALTDGMRSVLDIYKETPNLLTENLLKTSLVLNEYLDPNKIDYTKVLKYAAQFGTLGATVGASIKMASRSEEKEIAQYADIDTGLEKEETTKYASSRKDHIKQETAYRKVLFTVLNKTPVPSEKIIDLATDIIKHTYSPLKSAKKAWIQANIGLQNVKKAIMPSSPTTTLIDAKIVNLKKELKDVEINNLKKGMKEIRSSQYFANRDIKFNPFSAINDAAQDSYQMVLKSNVKNALSKSIYVLGSNTSELKEKKTALKILNKISKIHERTKTDNFDDYEIISEIAKERIQNFKNNSDNNLKFISFNNFSTAKNYVNNREAEIISQKKNNRENEINQEYLLSQEEKDQKIQDSNEEIESKKIPEKINYKKSILEDSIPYIIRKQQMKEEIENKAEKENKILMRRKYS